MPQGSDATGPADGSPPCIATAFQRQLRRAHDVQRANLLARLRAEQSLARSKQIMVVLGVEGLLRSEPHV